MFDVDAAVRAAAFEDQVSAVRVLLQKALVCGMKVQAWPGAPDVPAWLTEAALRRSQASQQCTAEINKRLVAQRIYRWALKDLPDKIDGRSGSANRWSLSRDDLISCWLTRSLWGVDLGDSITRTGSQPAGGRPTDRAHFGSTR